MTSTAQNAAQSTNATTPTADTGATANAQQNPSCAAIIRIATVPNAQARKVNPWQGTFDDLERNMRADGQRIVGKEGRGIIVSSFRHGDGLTAKTKGEVGWFRQKHLVDETWLLGLDFDEHPGDPLTVLEPLRLLGLDVIAYTSHSHGRRDYLRAKTRDQLEQAAKKKKKIVPAEEIEAAAEAASVVPRYRALLRFRRAVTPAELTEIHPHVCRYLGAVVDHAGADPNRLFYTPRMKAPDAELEPWIVRWRGDALDPDALPGGVSVAELLAIATAAKAPSRPPVQEAERVRRVTSTTSLVGRARNKAEERAERILQRAVDGLAAAASDLNNKLWIVGCRIGNWSVVIGPSGVAHWRARALEALGPTSTPAKDEDTLDRGIARGEGTPVDVDDAMGRRRSILPTPADDDVVARNIDAWADGLGDDSGTASNDDGGGAEIPPTDSKTTTAASSGPLSLDDARARIREVIGEALQNRGTTAVAADPGVGKTTVVVEALPELVAIGKRVRIALPTNKLAAEVHHKATRHAFDVLGGNEAFSTSSQMGLEPKRHAGNCQNWAAIEAARRANGIDGVREVCRRCNQHPNNITKRKTPKTSHGGLVRDKNGKTVFVEKWETPPCDFFVDVWAARDYRVTFTTHELEILRADARSSTWIDVGAFAEADPTTRYRPAARWTPDGLRLTLLEADDGGGAEPPALDTDDVEAACRAWLAKHTGAEADDLDSLRSKLADAADDADDLLVVDEAPKATTTARMVRGKDLAVWRGIGDLVVDEAPFTRLLGLMVEAGRDRRVIPSGTIASLVGVDDVKVRRNDDGVATSMHGARLMAEHGDTAAKGAIPLALKDAPDADALGVLEAACRRRWAGCYIDRKGVLHLSDIRDIVGAGARSTLYLDGTATEATARALFGDDVRFHRIAVKLHEGTTTTRVDWSASRSELPSVAEIEKEADGKKRDYLTRRRAAVLTRLRAIVQRYETPTTAWMLHKAWFEDDDVRALLRDAVDDKRVTYFAAADSVGSNRLKDCTRIVLADWFVPRAAVTAAAEVLAHRARRPAAWANEAQIQLEAAQWVQAAYRVRPAEAPREIVALTERELPPNFPAPVVVDVDELVADELGILPGGRKGAAMLLARTVREHGAVALGCGFTRPLDSTDSTIGGPQRRCETALHRALRAYDAHGRLPRACADAGVSLAFALTDAGNPGVPIAYTPTAAPSLDRVLELLTAAGHSPAWVQWQGERVDLDTGADEALAALVSLPSLDAVSWEAVASSLGVSPSTVRRRLRFAGLTSLEGLRAAWARAHTPDHVVVDDGDGGHVALVGTWAWRLVAPLPDVVAWERLHPSSTSPPPPSPCSRGWCARVFGGA